MPNPVQDVLARRELLGLLVQRNLKIRYKSSVLGFFWSLLTPVFFILIYWTFARILRFSDGQPDYLPFLIVGIITWQFLAMCLNDGLHAVVGNSNLIKKTAFPRVILPLATVAANFVNFLLTGVVLVVYLALVGQRGADLWLLPFTLLTHAALCLGLVLVLCTANVFFRDVEHILGVAMTAWFFLTPVFYKPELQAGFLPESLRWAVYLNPMTGLVNLYRRVFMGMDAAQAWHTWISFAVAWALLGMGLRVFSRWQNRFADAL